MLWQQSLGFFHLLLWLPSLMAVSVDLFHKLSRNYHITMCWKSTALEISAMMLFGLPDSGCEQLSFLSMWFKSFEPLLSLRTNVSYSPPAYHTKQASADAVAPNLIHSDVNSGANPCGPVNSPT